MANKPGESVMCQKPAAIMNQLVSALSCGQATRPNSKESAAQVAKEVQMQWVRSPRHLHAAVADMGTILNEARRLSDMPDCHDRDIAAALIEGVCQDPPEQLRDNEHFMIISSQLSGSIVSRTRLEASA